jgi:hypothetical protein
LRTPRQLKKQQTWDGAFSIVKRDSSLAKRREAMGRRSSLRDPAHKKRAEEKAGSSRNSIRDAKVRCIRNDGRGGAGFMSDLKVRPPKEFVLLMVARKVDHVPSAYALG